MVKLKNVYIDKIIFLISLRDITTNLRLKTQINDKKVKHFLKL